MAKSNYPKILTRPLRVGFDLDGVLLYNPARIVRPLIVFLKKIFIPKEANKFHYPKSRWQKYIWLLLHKSSFFLSSGLTDVKIMVRQKKIKAYIISARYDSLKEDFERWIKKIDADKYFSGWYYNSNDEQPHYYKEKMIRKLKLDLFVEDNWDIVRHLSINLKPPSSSCKIFWIYNLLDRNIKYKYKFPSLEKVISYIDRYLISKI